MSGAGPSGLTLALAPPNLGSVPAELFSLRFYLEAANRVHRQEVFV